MQLFDKINEDVYRAYVFWSSVLVVKMLVMSVLTGMQRFRKKVNVPLKCVLNLTSVHSHLRPYDNWKWHKIGVSVLQRGSNLVFDWSTLNDAHPLKRTIVLLRNISQQSWLCMQTKMAMTVAMPLRFYKLGTGLLRSINTFSRVVRFNKANCN